MKCRGTHKDTYGLGCNTEQDQRKLGLGMKCRCYSKFLRETDKGRERVKRHTLKATKPRKELEKAEKERKEKRSLSKEIEKTQTLVNQYVRMRDKGNPCISQQIQWQPDHEAGHLYSKKQYSAIRFEFDNIHSQSIYANRYLEGDFENYVVRIEKKIGKERLEALHEKARQCKKKVKKWTFEELKQIQNEAKKFIKELKKTE